MKKLSYVLVLVLALTAMIISACGGSAAISAPDSAAVNGGKPQASPVQFTGVIESINGNQWSINGQTITVDPSVVRDGPFRVGDTVKVEVQVQADGSMVVNSVETPNAVANSNDVNSNDVNSNDVNSNDANSNDANSNSNTNDGLVIDNSSTEAFGKVESITLDTVMIGGQVFTIANGAEFKNQIQAGDFVKVHFSLNADGTMSITQIETWDPASVTNGNSNSNTNTSLDDNGNASNSKDDNSNASNSNDDHDNNSNSNDDHGDNSNNDGGNDGNSNGG
jgi:hypothetical protein